MSLPLWIIHSKTGQRERTAIRWMTCRAKGFHVYILPHKASPTLNTSPEHPAKLTQWNQCWNANEPPDGSNAFMNNAVLCAVSPSKIFYVNNRTVFTLVKKTDLFVIKPGIFFFVSLVIFCRAYLLSSCVWAPDIFLFLHVKH